MIQQKGPTTIEYPGSRRKSRRSKKFYLLVCILLCISASEITVSFLAYVGYSLYTTDYQQSIRLAQTGAQDLHKSIALLTTLSKNPFDTRTLSDARGEALTALADFQQVRKTLASLPTALTSVPVYGTKLSAALHVLPLAIQAAQVSITGYDLLNLLIARFHDPLNSQSSGISTADFTLITQKFQQIETTLNTLTNQVLQLKPADLQLDPSLAKASTALRTYLPALHHWLGDTQTFLTAAPTLLGIGKPANYLIEVLDSTEMRPGGGFIGNYGIATLSGARLTAVHITDTYLLDKSFEFAGHSIPLPAAYKWFDLSPNTWSLRDSNLEADFPTAARNGELTYKEEGGTLPVQGVIAITPAMIAQALTITGPIYVPDYQETVTAQNLIALIHYHQLGPAGEGSSYIASPDGHSSERKRFTELLAELLFSKIRQLAPSNFQKFAQLAINGLHAKDMQIYLNSNTAEGLLKAYRLDAAIQSVPGDSLFVVDANITPNKANEFITNTLSDQVTIDSSGNVLHHTTLSYSWKTHGPSYDGVLSYRDYVRVYVPPGSTLHLQSGWQPKGNSKAFGHEVWAGLLLFSYGQTHTVTLDWAVPHGVQQNGHSWHYQFLIQRQAGSHWLLHVNITLPRCAAKIRPSGGLVAGKGQMAVLNQPLNADLDGEVDYTCS